MKGTAGRLGEPTESAEAEGRGFRLDRRRLLAGAAGAALLGPRGTLAKTHEDALIERIVARMSLRERIGQLFMFQAHGTVMSAEFHDLLTGVHPGGIIFVLPNIGTAQQIRDLVQAIHASNAFLPPWIAIDQEGGDVIRLQGDPAPGAMVLGSLPDSEVRSMSKARSEFLANYGFDVNFAPVADVAYTTGSTMYLRSFGSDPKLVADKVSAVVRGAQARRIMGAAKHFPGHGRTSIDSHFAIPTVDISFADWKTSDALPFRAAIHAGVEMVMIGHLDFPQWDDKPMSLSKVSVRTLRDDLKFDGVIVTDDLGMGALAGMDPLWVLDMAFAAGMDVFLYTMPPLPWATLVDHLVQRVERGEISEKRINASVRRIVRRKLRHFRLSTKDFAE